MSRSIGGVKDAVHSSNIVHYGESHYYETKPIFSFLIRQFIAGLESRKNRKGKGYK